MAMITSSTTSLISSSASSESPTRSTSTRAASNTASPSTTNSPTMASSDTASNSINNSITMVSSDTASTSLTSAPNETGLTTGSPSPTPSSSTTSVNSTPSIPTPSASSSAAGNISNGAAVGIGIGCALAGALLAGLILLLLLLRRNRRQPAYPQQHLPPSRRDYNAQEKHATTATSVPVQGSALANIDRLLPQPTEDDAIIGALSKIRDGIKNHAQNYYHNAPVKHEAIDEARLVDLANTITMPTSLIRDLLLNPATRVLTIRLFLGHLILTRCSGKSDWQLSFLPSEISNFATLSTGTAGMTASQATLFSKWKAISGALLQQKYGHQLDENDPRSGTIALALAAAEPILHPFINPSVDMNARRRNLEGIMRRAAQFAFLLFSQPGSYQFDFTGTGRQDSLLVFPALLQTANDEAQPIVLPRVLSEKEVTTRLGV